MPGELRVDPQVVHGCGQAMAALAAGLPPAPVGFSEVQAGDPLSAMAFTVQRAAEAPVLVGLPAIQADSAATAGKIPQAAAMYTSTSPAAPPISTSPPAATCLSVQPPPIR